MNGGEAAVTTCAAQVYWYPDGTLKVSGFAPIHLPKPPTVPVPSGPGTDVQGLLNQLGIDIPCLLQCA